MLRHAFRHYPEILQIHNGGMHGFIDVLKPLLQLLITTSHSRLSLKQCLLTFPLTTMMPP
jgi:hypothetical protein